MKTAQTMTMIMTIRETKKIFIIFIFLAVFFSCKKDGNDNFFDMKNLLKAKEIGKSEGFGVINVNRLRFRSENDIHSKTLMYLDKGEIVNIVKKDLQRVKVGEMEDYWYQIEYKGTTGWIFGYFVDIYPAIEDAKKNAIKYLNSDTENNTDLIENDFKINKNLFFIRGGKLFQVIDLKKRNFKKLNTFQDYIITDYFFNKDSLGIFYIAKKNINDNGVLYLYNLNTNTNQMIDYNIYTADISETGNLLIILNKYKNKVWQIGVRNLDLKTGIRYIAKINVEKEPEILKYDAFTLTLAREKSSLVYLKYDDKGNFIYFKPPEEKHTYIISAKTGENIKVEKDQDTNFYIDATRYLTISSFEESNKGIIYNIILNDKFSGMQKEIISSSFYPINFSVSPKKDYIGITMLDLSKKADNYYYSSVYILSLFSYSLLDVSDDGRSYLIKWSTKLID